MIFEIAFDEEIYREQNKLYFDSEWENNLKKNKKGFFYGIPMSVLGLFILIKDNELGLVFLMCGLFLIYTSYKYYMFYRKRYKFFFKSIDEEVIKNNVNKLVSRWEFNTDFFKYGDHRFEIKYNWEFFQSFKMIDENLFIYFDIEKRVPFILGKAEIDLNQFDKVIQFLNQKKNNLKK